MGWLDSVYSDGTKQYLNYCENVCTVRVRVWKEAPLTQVMVRLLINGALEYHPCEKDTEDEIFAYYKYSFNMTQSRILYEFLLLTNEEVYFYSQRCITRQPQDQHHDFVAMTDYVQPEWVKHAVFYQIFPERFYNGDPSLSVKNGEYQVNGFDTYHVEDWNTPAAPYEIAHCADFYGGDLIGIRKKIPYLKELGVTALYLNPIFQAPSVHKYDCIDYLHVDDHFGGDEALAELTAELHKNGMKLILDISINHTGTAHKWFNKDVLYYDQSVGAYHNQDAKERNYYMIREDGSYECWDNVPELPKLDFSSEALRDALYKAEESVLKKWLKPPYEIDGWRFDVADVMANFNEKQLAKEVWPEICKSIKETNPQAYILAEHWDDCIEYLQGNCWDAPMNYYSFGRVIRQFYGAPDPMMERNPEIWPKTLHMSAEEVEERVMNYLSALPFPIWQNQYNLFDSHDIGRFLSYPGMNERKFRGAVIAMFTMIGTPSVYYGDEAGIEGMTGFFEGARYPMPWDKDFQNTENYLLHKKLGELRKTEDVFSEGGFRFLYAKGNVIAFVRQKDQKAAITVLSSSEKPEEIELDLRVIGAASIQKELLGRMPEIIQEKVGRVKLTLEPEASHLFWCECSC